VSAEGRPALAGPAHRQRPAHAVQVYESEERFLDSAAAFLGSPPGAAIVAITTPEHARKLEARLPGRPLHLLDAQATLDRILVDGMPDRARFHDVVGGAVAAAAAQGEVRAFGEMVALLVTAGRPDAALRLEELWDELARARPMALLCAYPLDLFASATMEGAFRAVLDAHGDVRPPDEAAADLGPRGGAELRRATLALRIAARERERAETALARHEVDLRDFMENAAEGLHQVDGDGRVVWINRAELEMLGYAAHEVVGRPVELLHADPDALKDILARLRRGETLRNVPARLLAKDGSIRHVLVTSSGRFEGGRLVATRCFTRDVTDSVRLGEARRAAAALLEVMAEGFMQVDRSWQITFANPSARGGRSPRDLEGRVLWDLFPEVAGTEFERRYRAAMENGERATFESYYPALGAWLENTVLPVEEGIWIYYRDVSERHRVQALLEVRSRQQAAVARLGHEALVERNLQALLDRTVDEVARTLDVEMCKVLELVPGGEALLVRSGTGWHDGLVGTATVPADTRSQAGYTLAAARPVVVEDLGAETRFTGPALLRDHEVTSGMSVVIGGRTQPYGVLGVHTRRRRTFTADDVNFLEAVAHLLGAAIGRRRTEEELVRHRDHLEEIVAERTRRLAESNEELESFNYSVSHDLRTPLRAIAGFSGLLRHRHGAELGPVAQRLVEQVEDEAVRMGTLIEELLNLARYHRLELTREPVDLSALAEAALAALVAAHPSRKVAWSVEPGLRAEGDPRLLRVVLENLLGNAWKFTSRTPAARIEVSAVPSAKGLTLRVRDNGAGFDMAYAQKLFRPFQRLHSPTEFEGTGIGLATVARIVQRHGGTVWAEARLGEGASFYVSL
jgi:PAS domain S-box-containing protein